MKSRLSDTLLLLLSLALLAIVAACGPVNAPTSIAPEAGAPASELAESASRAPTATTSVAPTLPSDTPATNELAAVKPSIAIDPARSGTTEDGLPVGFTIEGYPYMGDPNAPVLMEEYSDYQCPFCARFFQQTFTELRQNQIANGELLLVFRDFPLDSIHPQATPAANAARCAGAQGPVQYWAMHDLLFNTVSQWSNNGYEQVFNDLASQAGLDTTQFAACIGGLTLNDAVKADFQHGQARGVSSTPYFFLNDQPLVGAQPLSVFNQAIALVLSGESIAAAQPTAAPSQPALAPTPATLSTNFAAVKGDPNAPVTIIEFTDYQCPFCQRHAQETLPTIMEEMVDAGQVYYILKDLPLENIHPAARAAANAARCAGDQGAYWEMHEALFANQSQWGSGETDTNQSLIDLGVSLGLDEASFTACVANQTYDSQVMDNQQEALSLGVGGTPFFFVNGYPLDGARPLEHFQIAVRLASEGTLAEAYVSQSPPTPSAPPTPSGPVDVSLDNGFGIGDPNAPVQIVEFTDYQCPFCNRHHLQTYPQLLEQYINTGQVYYVVKDFPLTSIHPQAFLASEAAWCAGEQRAQAEMADLLFATQGEWGSDEAANLFTEYAGTLGLDAAAFRECLDSGKYTDVVDSNLQQGIGLGITGTPTFFINGNILVGAYPIDAFAQAIEQALTNP